MSIITYDVDFIYQFRHKIKRELPTKVMKCLNMSTKIRTVMNEKDLKIFNRNLDNFDAEDLKKKLNSLFNKLSPANFDSILQKTVEILKNRKILIEYTVKNLINKAVLQPTYIDTYAKFYKQIYTDKTKAIFSDTFKDLFEVLNNSSYDKDKNYDELCKYMKDKTKYSGLYLFLVSLYEYDIIEQQIINDSINKLENTILKSSKEENDKYCEAYAKMIKKLNKKYFINLEKINEIKTTSELNMRLKFSLMDLEDLYKKLD